MTPSAPDEPGPRLLNERTLSGILVHLVLWIPLFGLLTAALMYLISDHPFTRANVANAVNWHLSVLALAVISLGLFFLSADEVEIGDEVYEWAILPEPLATVASLASFGLVLLLMFATFATIVFSLVAFVKAIFGTAWRYPLAYRFLAGADA